MEQYEPDSSELEVATTAGDGAEDLEFGKGEGGLREGAEDTGPRKGTTRQSKQCGFSIYIFDNSKSKSMVRSEKMALSGLVFARKIARMILIQNI